MKSLRPNLKESLQLNEAGRVTVYDKDMFDIYGAHSYSEEPERFSQSLKSLLNAKSVSLIAANEEESAAAYKSLHTAKCSNSANVTVAGLMKGFSAEKCDVSGVECIKLTPTQGYKTDVAFFVNDAKVKDLLKALNVKG